jgi:mono/diheme cytochrome c family protein
MKIVLKSLMIVVASMVVSCKDNANPNYQYLPNMYESVGYETYAESDAFKNGQEAQLPVKGTIKRGFVPNEFPNSPEGYALAKANLKSPLDSLSVNPEKGKELYGIYCAICHGESGNGKGKLVEREKFLGVPNYAERDITEGSIYHVITYGLNSMGSHANQLSQQERWLVAAHVLKLKSELSK